jgi:hypothetical protein
VIADALEASIGESLRRLGPRFLARADDPSTPKDDKQQPVVAYEDLITSHEVDRFVGRALCTKGAIRVGGVASRRPRAARALRTVDVTWLTDPALWNWVRAEPSDATAEEVAAALWLGDGEVGSYLAMWLTPVPPYFAVHPSKAVRFAEARDRRPHGPDIAEDETEDISLPALAAREEGDRAALAQASQVKVPRGGDAIAFAKVALGDSDKQVAAMIETLTNWGLAPDLIATQRVIKRIRDHVEGDERDARAWAKVAIAQRQHLFEIAGRVSAISLEVGTAGRRA